MVSCELCQTLSSNGHNTTAFIRSFFSLGNIFSALQVILMMFVHLCRKVIYGLDVSYRICVYILGTLMISVVSDYKTPTQNR